MSKQHEPTDRDHNDPTPEEIRERSAKIRKGWSRRVTARRQVWTQPAWRPPLILTIELVRQLNESQE